jgi:hypothetical protein
MRADRARTDGPGHALLLITAYSIGAVRVWREDRRLRRDFEQVVAEKRVSR